jgi:hypothetical protein
MTLEATKSQRARGEWVNTPPFLFAVPRKKQEEAAEGMVVAIKLGPVLAIFARSASSDQSTQVEMIAEVFEELMSKEAILALAKKVG